MLEAFQPLCQAVSLDPCREWHAAIALHGKAFRTQPPLDETWLILP